MYDLGSVSNEVYLRLNKSPAVKGFYTRDRCVSAVNEAFDFVATEMMIYDNGFNKKLDFLDVAANQLTIPVPPHVEIIQSLRYLVGNVYTPMIYDSNFDAPEWAINSGATSLPSRYRIVDNNFYFNPAIGVGGPNYLQIEYMRFPSVMRDDSQQVDPQFNRAMIHFITYRACSVMANTYGLDGANWRATESMWYDKMIALIEKRNSGTRAITDFCGY